MALSTSDPMPIRGSLARYSTARVKEVLRMPTVVPTLSTRRSISCRAKTSASQGCTVPVVMSAVPPMSMIMTMRRVPVLTVSYLQRPSQSICSLVRILMRNSQVRTRTCWERATSLSREAQLDRCVAKQRPFCPTHQSRHFYRCVGGLARLWTLFLGQAPGGRGRAPSFPLIPWFRLSAQLGDAAEEQRYVLRS